MPKEFRPKIQNKLSNLNHEAGSIEEGTDKLTKRVMEAVLKNCASVLTSCQVKLFRFSLSTSIFPPCWKHAYVQPVRQKGDSSNPSYYRPNCFLSCLYKAFKTILKRKIHKHLSALNLLSDRLHRSR